MDAGQIRAQIKEAIEADAPYAVFTKPDDADSNCVIEFIEQSGIIAKVFDIGTSTGFVEMDRYSLLECDVPCVCSTEDYRTLYEGCPGRVDQLREF